MYFAGLVEENVPQLRKDLEESVVPPARDFAAEVGTHDDARALREKVGSNTKVFLHQLDHGSEAAREFAGAFREWCLSHRLYDPWLWRAALESIVWAVGGMEREYILEPTVPPNEFSLDHPLDDGLAAPDWELILRPGTSVPMHGLNVHMTWEWYAEQAREAAGKATRESGQRLPDDMQFQLDAYHVTAEEWTINGGFSPMPDIRRGAGDPYLWTVQHQFITGIPKRRRSFREIAGLQQQESGGRKPSREGVKKAVHRVATLLPLTLGDAPNRPVEIPTILEAPLKGSP